MPGCYDSWQGYDCGRGRDESPSFLAGPRTASRLICVEAASVTAWPGRLLALGQAAGHPEGCQDVCPMKCKCASSQVYKEASAQSHVCASKPAVRHFEPALS